MLKQLTNTSELALRYYRVVHPERDYSDRRAALRQFIQDKHIDKRTLKKVARDIAQDVQKIIEEKY